MSSLFLWILVNVTFSIKRTVKESHLVSYFWPAKTTKCCTLQSPLIQWAVTSKKLIALWFYWTLYNEPRVNLILSTVLWKAVPHPWIVYCFLFSPFHSVACTLWFFFLLRFYFMWVTYLTILHFLFSFIILFYCIGCFLSVGLCHCQQIS